MSLLREKRFKTLLDLADEAQERGYAGFDEYCRLREEGLRAEAFVKLETFVDRMAKQPFATRRAFAGWLMAFCFYNPQVLEACPVLVRAEIVAPTVEEWIRTEPENPQALRWSRDERAVLVAVRAAPHDEVAVGRFAAMRLARVEFSAHAAEGEEADSIRQDLLDLEAVIALMEASRAAVLKELLEEAREVKASLQERVRAAG